MRVHIGGDHAAFDLKGTLVTFLQGKGYDVIDHGPEYLDPQDDYPVAVLRAAEAVSGDLGSFGIVLGGSGNGEQMAANKVKGIRAALACTVELAELARTHNNAQVLSIGARMNTEDEAKAIVERFLSTKFSGDERHARRLAMVERYEQDRQLPPVPASEG
jgi:ribose 5-phosphate isomerase B